MGSIPSVSEGAWGRSPPGNYDLAVSRASIERQLVENGEKIRQLRSELAIADEQLAQLADEAGDARLRALVSETPLADREHRQAERHASAMRRHRQEVAAVIEQLEHQQDMLLDRL